MAIALERDRTAVGESLAAEITPLEIRTRDGLTLRGRRYLPSTQTRGMVVLAHGKSEHQGRHRFLIDGLTTVGFGVFAVDHRGHGLSDGQRGVIRRFDDFVDDLDQVVQLAEREGPGRRPLLVGHSMGGAIATRYALLHQDRLAALVLSSAALELAPGMPGWQKRMLLVVGALAPSRTVPPGPPHQLSTDPAIEAGWDADPLCDHNPTTLGVARALFLAGREALARAGELRLPLYVLHGEEDTMTGPSGSRALVERAGSADKTLRIWSGSRHECFNDRDRDHVLAETVDWLTARF